MDRNIGRESKKRRKLNGDYSTPFYNPKYTLVESRLDVGTPVFTQMTGRSTMITEPQCKNIYDVSSIQETLERSALQAPIFSKMYGRDTLDQFSPIKSSKKGKKSKKR